MLYDLVHLYNDLGICVTAYYLTGSTPLTIFYIIINRLGYLYKFYVDSMIKKKKDFKGDAFTFLYDVAYIQNHKTKFLKDTHVIDIMQIFEIML